jgi:outer membrane translocation and assembly module TamA
MENRHHGTLRGLEYVTKSSTDKGRFGRMFRWLKGEVYSEADLKNLAKAMVQQEFSGILSETPTEIV